MKLKQEEKNIINNATNILYGVSAHKEFKNFKDSLNKKDEPLYSKIVNKIYEYKED